MENAIYGGEAMEIGVVALSLSCMDFTEMLEFVRDIGGTTIELCTVKGAHNGTVNLGKDHRSELVEAVESRGLSIVSVAGYNNFVCLEESELEREVVRLEWYCELASDLGVGIVRAMTGDPHPDLSQEEMVDSIIRGFRLAVQVARKHNVVLALENHGHVVNDGQTLLKIINGVSDHHLRLTIDTGNFCWAGHSVEDAHRFIRHLVPHTANVHLKDLIFAEKEAVQFVPLGQGKIDLKMTIEQLAAEGYNGALLCEYEGMGDPKDLLGAGTFTRDRFVKGLKRGTRESLTHLETLL
jgi:sugar phosphate isomerase/epimerase